MHLADVIFLALWVNSPFSDETISMRVELFINNEQICTNKAIDCYSVSYTKDMVNTSVFDGISISVVSIGSFIVFI